MYAKTIRDGRTRHYKIAGDFIESGHRYVYFDINDDFPDDFDYREQLEIPINSYLHVNVSSELQGKTDLGDQGYTILRWVWWYRDDAEYAWTTEGVVTSGELYIVTDNGETFDKV